MEGVIMKYRVTVTKTFLGNIIVNAKEKDEATEKARQIVYNDSYKWYEEECIDVHEVHELPLFCTQCDTKLTSDSLFCHKCGAKIATD